MKTWIKRSLIGLFSASVLVGGLTACAGGQHGRSGMAAMSDEDYGRMRGHLVERAGKELNLDAAQKQRLQALADTLRAQRSALVGNTDPRAEAQALVAGAKFDRERAQAFVEARTSALRSKSPEMIAATADFYDSLNPEQQQKLRDFMAKKRGRWMRG